MKFGTKAIHIGQEPDKSTGSITVPIYQTSTYAQDAIGKSRGYEYSRTGNPTRSALERSIAALEEGRFGLAFSSGMSASDAVIRLLSEGEHTIVSADVYGGTYRLFTKVLERHGLEFSFVDTSEPSRIKKAIRNNTKMIWIETPSNPLLKITDIREVAETASERGITTAVDNTFMSPYLQRPLEMGADIVVHSTTKYLGGHSDIVGGAIATKNEGIYNNLKFLQNAVGAVPGPFDCWLVLRGIKTLALRMERHCSNAMAIATFLESVPSVKDVIYPGLSSHPQHKLAKRQMDGFGGMITLEMHNDRDAKRLAQSTRIFTLAESLGAVESLISSPSAMTHASIPGNEREKKGIRDSMIRLSVGIEDQEDLIDDLRQAFKKVESVKRERRSTGF